MSRFVLTAQLQLQAPGNVAQVVRQIQNQLQNVTVNVQVQNAAQTTRQVQQLTRQTNRASTAAERMGRAFAVSVRRFAAFSIATRAVGLFTSRLADAVDQAINFERQLVKVSQVTGESLSKLSRLTKTITTLSTSMGVMSSDLLGVSTVLLQAGLNSRDTEIALKSLAKAALAPNFDSISETAEGAIAILAQFQQGVGALESQLGSINSVAGAFAVEAGDLIDVIRRTGGVFKASGGSLNELLALFTSVRATTRESAESIGTGLRTIFTRIQRPKTIEFLKQFGVELIDLQGKFVGPYKAAELLSKALAGLGEGDLTFIRVAEELGGFRQIGKVLPLLQQFSTAQAALNVANKSGNSLTQDAATAQQALAIRITKVREEFLALVRSITETSTFQIMANTALSFASSLIKISEAIKPLLPLLGALAAVKLARGIGTFAGGLANGLASTRTFNAGGKVQKFATGGLVPGVGNRDTVPAMLTPGEFVIKKSSVKKLGVGGLAAMNENRFARGGQTKASHSGMSTEDVIRAARGSVTIPRFAKESSVGIATASFLPSPVGGSISVSRSSLAQQVPGGVGVSLASKYGKKNVDQALATIFPNQSTFKYRSVIEGVGKDEEAKFVNIINQNLGSAVVGAASEFATQIMGTTMSSKDIKLPPNFYTTLDQGFRGQLFEGVISALSGKPLISQDSRRPIDFTRGLGSLKSIYSNLPMDYVDAKITKSAAGIGLSGKMTTPGQESLTTKVAQQLALESIPFVESVLGPGAAEKHAKAQMSDRIKKAMQKRHFGGIVQKFAGGGKALPLVDDILGNHPNAILPHPDKAIQALIAAGGGAVDFDRTLVRSVGDHAYAKAKTGAAKDAVLGRYFRDGAGRMEDVRNGRLTQFGRALQGAIKSGQINPANLSVISKSSRVPGLAEYISQLFGIPLGNIGFTSGGSKDPMLSAHSTKGPRASRVKRFAAGGGVGTDTVPALLTPGEFVVNRASAQKIGYSNLNRMNKVGRYAKGGVVQHFSQGTTGRGVRAGLGGYNTTSGPTTIQLPADQVAALGDAAQTAQRSMLDVAASNKFAALSITSGFLQSMLPAVDENSSALTKLTHDFSGLITTVLSVGFALEAFGAKMSAGNILDALKGGGLSKDSLRGVYRTAREILPAGGAKAITGFVSVFAKAAGPVGVVVTGLYLLGKASNAVANSLFGDLEKIKNAAIQKGDILGAGTAAGYQARRETATVGVLGTAAAGAAVVGGAIASGTQLGTAVGAAFGGVGAIPGAAIGALLGAVSGVLILGFDAMFTKFTDRYEIEAANYAMAMAAQSKVSIELTKSQANAALAADKFKSGAISAADYLKTFQDTGKAINVAKQYNDRVVQQSTTGKSELGSGLILRTLGAYLGGGLFGMETAGTRNTRLTQEGVNVTKSSRENFTKFFTDSTEARNATIRSVIARGGDIDKAKKAVKSNTGLDYEEMAVRAATLGRQAERARVAGDTKLAGELDTASSELLSQSNALRDSFENIAKEVERAKASFAAMNLGLRGPTATATALSSSLDRFAAGLEVGGNTFSANAQFLSEAMTTAAQAMDPKMIKSATEDVAKNLSNMGMSKSMVDKFRANTDAFIGAQQNYNAAFDNIKKGMIDKDFQALSSDALKGAFAKELTVGLGDEAKKNLTDIINGIELSDTEVDQILGGNLQVFGDKLSEAGKKQVEEIVKIAQERQKAEQILVGFIRQRAEVEREFVSAQREAIDLTMEGRDVQAKYGGRAVSSQERLGAILGKANAGAGRRGLANLTTGSVDELRARNAQIRAGFGGIEGRRRQDGGMQGADGASADEQQKNLEAAQKDQVATIRELIKFQEEELRIISEKNKLEKQSLESLITGDIEKFFDQQAAVGATAAIATGNQSIMGQFGASALAGAYSDIQRQQEAGVQSLYGRQLSGAGGLVEQSAGAALRARGVQSGTAMQVMAQTTPEEEAAKARLRELGGVLGETGRLGADMAEMKFDTATFNVDKATAVFNTVETIGLNKTVDSQPQPFARGGVVYASRGMFVPRGTDTVPAMLTPGEFVVNRGAVQRGNNLALLKAINGGGGVGAGHMSRGGSVGYYNNGGSVQYKSWGGVIGGAASAMGLDKDTISKLGQVFTSFTNGLNDSIRNLQNTKFQIKLDTTNVNVNINGTSFLAELRSSIQSEFMKLVSDEISQYQVGSGGKLTKGGPLAK